MEGRRGSELACGKWKDRNQNVLAADSTTLHFRLSRLDLQDRSQILESFESCKAAWSEEVKLKTQFWEELPHLMLGLWPPCGNGQEVATRVLQKWAEAKERDAAKRAHRLTWRTWGRAVPSDQRSNSMP